jgi:DNA (cytosine-5)-methyltransferase 1
VVIHDYCCCAGLGADGYASIFGATAIHGFDLHPQPDYPYAFTQANVMTMLEDGLPPATFRHFSFPCQALTTAAHLRTAQGGVSKYDDLLTPGLAIVRERYNDTPWVMENVDDRSGNVRQIMAPRDGESLIVLCGTMFGLPIWRHRLFLANFPLRQPAPTGKGKYRGQGCRHETCPVGPNGRPKPIGIYHVMGDRIPDGGATAADEEQGRRAMGSHRTLPWDKLKEGFPPAYTAWVGADLLRHLATRQEHAA